MSLVVGGATRMPPRGDAEIIRGLSLEDYIASPHVSHTGLRDFVALGPRGFFLRHVHRSNTRQQTPAMGMGQTFEDILTERWEPVVKPTEMLSTVKGKTLGKMVKWNANQTDCKKWLADNPGAISRDEYDNLMRMRDSVMANQTARELLERAEEQVTLRVPFEGLPGLQSRPDWMLLEHAKYGPTYIDLKKVQTLPRFRKYGVHDYGCNTQAGLCEHVLTRLGVTGTTYYLLAVEEAFPNRAVLQRLTPYTVATGELWCMDRCRELAEHYESDHFPSTISDVEDLDAPVRGVTLDCEGP